ncbi:response regulator transcription factor [Brevundimonas sp.]|jgi:two-component system response regulator QseB|uniref:response regulator transcription factor n=1 Tax=Brevundimonas sp. TaxID=1871086 RepID=UPI0025BC17CE|nr:response regulator transcription factor [Brevundimonas sp.]
MKVLLVEDNRLLGESTARSLTRAGFSVDLADRFEDGWHAWRTADYDVVVLDIMLGEDSGLDLLARARAAGRVCPVLLLTALGDIDRRVEGLNAGADDYLVKPFALEELIARLRALARRPASMLDPVLRYGNVRFDTGAREVAVDDQVAQLSRGEGIVLERFLRTPDRIITREQLGESLYSYDQDYTENSIQVHVHRVRRKLAELNAGMSIRAIRGLGYMAIETQPSPMPPPVS